MLEQAEAELQREDARDGLVDPRLEIEPFATSASIALVKRVSSSGTIDMSMPALTA